MLNDPVSTVRGDSHASDGPITQNTYSIKMTLLSKTLMFSFPQTCPAHILLGKLYLVTQVRTSSCFMLTCFILFTPKHGTNLCSLELRILYFVPASSLSPEPKVWVSLISVVLTLVFLLPRPLGLGSPEPDQIKGGPQEGANPAAGCTLNPGTRHQRAHRAITERK